MVTWPLPGRMRASVRSASVIGVDAHVLAGRSCRGCGYNFVILICRMQSTKKTAVSLPRLLADRAERAARRRGIPRSRLFAMALEAFLVDEQETDEELTAQINAVLADEAVSSTPEQVAEDEVLEAWLTEAGRRALDMVEWKE